MATANYFDVPNSETPITLRKNPSLQISQVFYQSEPYWVVKSPHNQEYHYLNKHEFAILDMLDGTISYRAIQENFNRQHSPSRVNFREITKVLTEFFKNSIVEPTSGGVSAGLHVHSREKRREKLKQKFKNILAIKWKGWDPQWFLDRTFPYVSWFFSKPVVIANMVFLALTVLWIGLHFTEFYSRLPEIWSFFDPVNWASMALALVLSKLLHELGHAYTQKKFGGECHEIGVMIFFFMPTLYCNTSDSWMLKNKWQRMAVGLGGIYVELVIFMIAACCWWFASVGNFQNFCMNMMFVCSISAALTNGNPLMKFDGYYVLADWLELPNLAQKANKETMRLFLHYGCGDRRKVDLWTSAHNKRAYLIYGVAAFLFRIFLIVSISFLLIEYAPKFGLVFWALLLAAFSIITVFFPLGKAVYKHLKEPGNWQQMKRKNLLLTFTLVAIVGAVVFWVPFPSWAPAECAVRIAGESRVFVKEGGKLAEILVRPGDHVAQGDPILRLLVPQLEQQKHEMPLNQREKSNKHLGDLLVVAPIDGVIIGITQGAKLAETRDRTLNKTFGNPLDVANLNGTLSKGDLVCIVAPLDREEISLVIEQKHIGQVKVGQATKIMLASCPKRLYGEILSVSSAESHVDELPEPIRNNSKSAAVEFARKLDNPQARKNIDYKDGQTISTTLVQATSSHSADGGLLYGSTGTAYIRTGQKTLAQKLADAVNEILLTTW